MKEVYLDNSATTRTYESVIEIMSQIMRTDYGNPSSKHIKGVEAEKYIKEAKKNIAKVLKVQDKEIFFTSGGTESNNLALIGTALANKRTGNHIITSQVEHSSVVNTVKYLEEMGFRITRLPVDKNGVVLLDKLEEAITEETIIVSIMHVNNEIGSIQPIEQIGEIIKRKNPKINYHVDTVQSFGKFMIHPQKFGIDLLSVSGHKIHGPKGIGLLYIHKGVKIKPLIYGGEQQNGVRSGTENVPGIAGIGEAVRKIYTNWEDEVGRLQEIKEEFVNQLGQLEGVHLNSKNQEGFAPHIVSASFEGIKSEVLLHALEDYGIYVSSGSACNANKHTQSGTLLAIGLQKDLLDCTIRFSFSYETTKEELEYCITSLKEILPKLRLYRKR